MYVSRQYLVSGRPLYTPLSHNPLISNSRMVPSHPCVVAFGCLVSGFLLSVRASLVSQTICRGVLGSRGAPSLIPHFIQLNRTCGVVYQVFSTAGHGIVSAASSAINRMDFSVALCTVFKAADPHGVRRDAQRCVGGLAPRDRLVAASHVGVSGPTTPSAPFSGQAPLLTTLLVLDHAATQVFACCVCCCQSAAKAPLSL